MSTESMPASPDTHALCSKVFSKLMDQKQPLHACDGLWSITEWCGVTSIQYVRDSEPGMAYVVRNRWSRLSGHAVTVNCFATNTAEHAVALKSRYRSVPDFLRAVVDATEKLYETARCGC